ncbi:MAG: hypothetical protein NVSMB23_27620 [Myxococcales bacterium]
MCTTLVRPIALAFAALALSMSPSSARAQAASPPPAPMAPSAQPDRKPAAIQPAPGSAPVAQPPDPVAATPAAPAESAAPAAHDHAAGPEDDPKLTGDDPRWRRVSLRILSPKEGAVVPEGPVSVTLALQGYQTPGAAPAAGQKAPHVHLIIDDTPYKADYDPARPFDLGALSAGPHTLRAFPSRPWHESLKSCRGCFQTVRFWVGKKGRSPGWFDPRKPLLTYSRPKGDYAGADAKRIMVDFYLTGAKLSAKGPRVLFSLDGKEQEPFTAWKPRWIDDLAPGEHTFKLTLVNAKGTPIENGGVNSTERKIQVK